MSWMTGWVGKASDVSGQRLRFPLWFKRVPSQSESSGVAPDPVRIRGLEDPLGVPFGARYRVADWGDRWSRGVGRSGWVGVGAAFFGSLLRAWVGLVGTVARGSGWVGESVWVRAPCLAPGAVRGLGPCRAHRPGSGSGELARHRVARGRPSRDCGSIRRQHHANAWYRPGHVVRRCGSVRPIDAVGSASSEPPIGASPGRELRGGRRVGRWKRPRAPRRRARSHGIGSVGRGCVGPVGAWWVLRASVPAAHHPGHRRTALIQTQTVPAIAGGVRPVQTYHPGTAQRAHGSHLVHGLRPPRPDW